MKDVIDLLKDAEHSLRNISFGLSASTNSDIADETIACVRTALEKLQAPPRYETPEQYKQRTGKDWPDNNAVYFYAGRRNYCGFVWGVCRYETAKRDRDICVIASESGVPPDDWKPDSAV